MTYIIDTNILVLYVRANTLSRKIESDLQLLTGQHNIVLSIISIGEIKSIAIQNNWGINRLNILEKLISKFLIADINAEEVFERYAEIDAYSQGKLGQKKSAFSARNMGKNDLWIAAIGSVLNLPLITTDNDFDHLNSIYLQIEKIDLTEYLDA